MHDAAFGIERTVGVSGFDKAVEFLEMPARPTVGREIAVQENLRREVGIDHPRQLHERVRRAVEPALEHARPDILLLEQLVLRERVVCDKRREAVEAGALRVRRREAVVEPEGKRMFGIGRAPLPDALELIGADLGVRQAVRIQAEIDKHVLRQVDSDGRSFMRLIGKSGDRLARMALGNFLRHPFHEAEAVCRRASSESCRLVLRPTFVAKTVRIVVHAFEAIVVAPPLELACLGVLVEIGADVLYDLLEELAA